MLEGDIQGQNVPYSCSQPTESRHAKTAGTGASLVQMRHTGTALKQL